jgi:hypothetical protein
VSGVCDFASPSSIVPPRHYITSPFRGASSASCARTRNLATRREILGQRPKRGASRNDKTKVGNVHRRPPPPPRAARSGFRNRSVRSGPTPHRAVPAAARCRLRPHPCSAGRGGILHLDKWQTPQRVDRSRIEQQRPRQSHVEIRGKRMTNRACHLRQSPSICSTVGIKPQRGVASRNRPSLDGAAADYSI